MIRLRLEHGSPLRAIPRSTQRASTSIGRELKRDGSTNLTVAPGKRGRPGSAGYRAPRGHVRTDALPGSGRYPSRLTLDGAPRRSFARQGRQHHLPERIAGILRGMNSDNQTSQIGPETIDNGFCAMRCGTLRRELIACVRQICLGRRSRAMGERRRGAIANTAGFHALPAQIGERAIPGPWEGNPVRRAGRARTPIERVIPNRSCRSLSIFVSVPISSLRFRY